MASCSMELYITGGFVVINMIWRDYYGLIIQLQRRELQRESYEKGSFIMIKNI
jgi:hypothetical protein